jgi:hypothetical protein
MIVSDVTSASGTAQPDWEGKLKNARNDFTQLMSSLQGGNLSAAQQSFAALLQLQAPPQAATDASGTASTAAAGAAITPAAAGSTTAATGAQADWSALNQALAANDIAAAQAAFAKLQQDLQTQSAGHHRKHHHHHGVAATDPSATSSGAATTAGQTATTTGSAFTQGPSV